MYNSGVLSSRGNEGGKTLRTVATPSPVTLKRIDMEKQIEEMAKVSGMSLSEAVTKLLVDPKSQESLIYYIRNKYESTMRDPVKLAMQAILLRFRDIATIAKALNISDAEAMIEVENAEWQAIQNNATDAGILPYDVQACLAIGIDELLASAKTAGVATDTPGLFSKMIAIVGDNYEASLAPIIDIQSNGANNADGGTINLNDYHPDSSTVDTSGVYNGSSSSSSGSSGGWLSDVFGAINNAIGVVKNATGAINGITGATTGAINTVGGAVNEQVSSIGGLSINKSSLPWIIGGGILLIIVVIVIIYATNRK